MDVMKDFQLLIYNTPTEDAKVDVVLKDETIWATQKAMSSLFGVQVPDISKHIKDIFDSGELDASTTVSKMETVVQRGFRGAIPDLVTYYSLDMIIAVGYRVSSARATAFRIWATSVLKEYIKKGFVLDDRRMKDGGAILGKDYFRELLERVRSIRASERRIWQQITDIYAMIQNKFHYAISGKTAAEIVYDRADRNKEHMGLTTWKNAPDGRILKSDVLIAKNYLPEKEIKRLERAITGYFDYIEDIIENENTFTMEQFASSVNEFLAFRRFQVLPDHRKGQISHEEAQRKAQEEYAAYNKTQKIVSDFDKEVKQVLGKKQ